jgi:Dolichyl-phosphate-mannose-protein mannosyltransferase
LRGQATLSHLWARTPGAKSRDLRISLAVFALLLGVYGVVSPQRFEPGYEAMYPGAAEGLLRTGVPQLVRSSPLFPLIVGSSKSSGPSYPGPTVGWAGPATAAPLMAAATVADRVTHVVTGRPTGWFRIHSAYSFAAVLMAATGAALYWLAYLLFGNRRRAVALALSVGLATLLLPYARIGMEPPLTFWTTAGFAFAVTARRRQGIGWWLAAGIAFAFAGATRMPAAPVLVVPLLVYALAGIDRRRGTVSRVVAVVVPSVVGGLLSLEYNRARCHALLCGFAQFQGSTDLHIRAGVFEGIVGYLASPGKSIFVTSPILVLAVFGIAPGLRAARSEVVAILVTAVLGIVAVSTLTYWSDEMYGARYGVYLVPLLAVLVGFALGWGGEIVSASRMRAFLALVAVGVLFQLVAIIPSGGVSPCVYVAQLLGPQRFDQNDCRFVPELSDVAMNFRLTYELVRQSLGRSPYLVYEPYVGTPGGDREHRRVFAFPLGAPPLDGPDVFWWKGLAASGAVLLVFFTTLGVAGALRLRALVR